MLMRRCYALCSPCRLGSQSYSRRSLLRVQEPLQQELLCGASVDGAAASGDAGEQEAVVAPVEQPAASQHSDSGESQQLAAEEPANWLGCLDALPSHTITTPQHSHRIHQRQQCCWRCTAHVSQRQQASTAGPEATRGSGQPGGSDNCSDREEAQEAALSSAVASLACASPTAGAAEAAASAEGRADTEDPTGGAQQELSSGLKDAPVAVPISDSEAVAANIAIAAKAALEAAELAVLASAAATDAVGPLGTGERDLVSAEALAAAEREVARLEAVVAAQAAAAEEAGEVLHGSCTPQGAPGAGLQACESAAVAGVLPDAPTAAGPIPEAAPVVCAATVAGWKAVTVREQQDRQVAASAPAAIGSVAKALEAIEASRSAVHRTCHS